MVESITYESAKTLKPGDEGYFNRFLGEGPIEAWHSRTGSQTGWYPIRGVEVRPDNVLLNIGDGHRWSYEWFSDVRRRSR